MRDDRPPGPSRSAWRDGSRAGRRHARPRPGRSVFTAVGGVGLSAYRARACAAPAAPGGVSAGSGFENRRFCGRTAFGAELRQTISWAPRTAANRMPRNHDPHYRLASAGRGGHASRSARRLGPASTTHVPALRLIGEPVMQAFGEASKHRLTPSATSVGGSANLSQPSAPMTSAGGEVTLMPGLLPVWNRTQAGSRRPCRRGTKTTPPARPRRAWTQ